MKYKSELIKEIVDIRGHEKSSLHYESECIESWVEEAKGAYPKICDYESEWMNYIDLKPVGNFPYVILSDVTEATVDNVVPYAYKTPILKGSTKYRNIDTREILDAFDETKNLELVSVKMPVLTTSNEDGTKTNILTIDEDVELRGIGGVKDELNLLDGELTQRIGVIVFDGNENWLGSTVGSSGTFMRFYTTIKNVNLNENGNNFLCNRFNNMSHSNWNKEMEGIHGKNSQIHFNIHISELESNDVIGFKKWLSKNPVTVQHQLAEETIKTVDLTVVNQDGETLTRIIPIEGTMHLSTSSETIKPLFSGEIPVEAIVQNLASFIEVE